MCCGYLEEGVPIPGVVLVVDHIQDRELSIRGSFKEKILPCIWTWCSLNLANKRPLADGYLKRSTDSRASSPCCAVGPKGCLFRLNSRKKSAMHMDLVLIKSGQQTSSR
ncbi:hypothetical protein AVEN_264766-1 [Araneus ventricosus]|uniref:Uncharacterized protein n=1 Tax=Araneus ventricosus TaxID=182803 RepID=A0A4Y2ECQ5_ARAVE|nr:hypothetical protein AVEN_264766-1 [Araneus ventricosus]